MLFRLPLLADPRVDLIIGEKLEALSHHILRRLDVVDLQPTRPAHHGP